MITPEALHPLDINVKTGTSDGMRCSKLKSLIQSSALRDFCQLLDVAKISTMRVCLRDFSTIDLQDFVTV